MHFWIDKRSQQCGFGRSRVAASLSASSGGGVGLSFGHPPRRMHSSNKSTASNNQISSIHNASRQQQQQQHQHNHIQQYTTNNASTSTATSSEHCNSRNFHQQFINNNNLQTCTANSRSTQQQQHNHVNNNAHHHQQQQQQQQLQQQQFNNLLTNNTIQPNAVNNNQQNRGNCQGLNTMTAATQALQHYHHHHYQHDMRYHHPQFGNMSVRHYQPTQPTNNMSQLNELRASSMPTVHTTLTTAQTTTLNNLNGSNCQSTSTPYRTNFNNIIANQTVSDQQQQLHLLPQHDYGTLLHETQHVRGNGTSSPHQIQQYQQPTNRQSLNYPSNSPRTQLGSQCTRSGTLHASGAPSVLLGSASVSNNNNNRGGAPATFNEVSSHHHHHQHYQSQQQHQQQQQQHANHRQLHALIDPSETQLLPSHLKSGVCASLILASIFVAAAKFYFDHQNSGLEVLIFIAFSMTFLLAACTVSLCRIPKGIIVQRPTGLHTTRNADSSGVGGHGGNAGTGIINRNDANSINSTCQQVLFTRPLTQEHALAAQAGPPPYHIAILLPENGCKDEEESPPPSYDKILI